MVALFGLATPQTALAGVVVLLAHAMYKSAMFISGGIIEKLSGKRDIRHLNGLGKQEPVLFVASALAAASMAGLPPLVGFLAKEEMLRSLLETPLAPLLGVGRNLIATYSTAGAFVVVVATSTLTVAYSARFIKGAFGSRTHEESALWGTGHSDLSTPVLGESCQLNPIFLSPLILLTGGSALLGVYPRAFKWLAVPAAKTVTAIASATVDGQAHVHDLDVMARLTVWSGFSTSFALSIGAVIAGLLLYRKRICVEQIQRRLPHIPDSLSMYRRSLETLLRVAYRVTGIAQCGSLPVYLAVTALIWVVLPAAPLLQTLLAAEAISPPDHPAPSLSSLPHP